MGEAVASVQVLMDGHGAARQAGSPAHRFNLQTEILNADRVVAIHRALELQREDEIQIPAATRHKRAARLRRPYLKTAVELGHVVLPQNRIRGFQRRDPLQPQFLRQPSLPGAEVAFTASPRLRRVGGNHLNVQSTQGSSHLGQTMAIDFPSTFGVSQKWLPRSLYSAQNTPLRSITSFSPAITVTVDSSSTNCA